jgi:hypothetical protein
VDEDDGAEEVGVIEADEVREAQKLSVRWVRIFGAGAETAGAGAETAGAGTGPLSLDLPFLAAVVLPPHWHFAAGREGEVAATKT